MPTQTDGAGLRLSDETGESSPESQPASRSFETLRFALVAVALATWARLLLDALVANWIPNATLLFAVLVTARYAASGPHC